MRVAADRVAAGQETSQLLGVYLQIGLDRWRAQLTHEGTPIHPGFFDREEDAGHAVDWALVNIFDRPDDVNYNPAGERTGNDPRRLQLAAGTANLVGSSKRASTYEGVGKHRDGFRANLRIPLCLLDNKGRRFSPCPYPSARLSQPGECAPAEPYRNFTLQWLPRSRRPSFTTPGSATTDWTSRRTTNQPTFRLSEPCVGRMRMVIR